MNDDTREWLQRRALQGAPHEVCGFVMKDGSVIEIPNSSHDPRKGFVMAREHLVARVPNVADIQAIWHSHPGGTNHPSKGDIDSIFHGAIDKGWKYLIVTKDKVIEYNTENYARVDLSFWSEFAEHGSTTG